MKYYGGFTNGKASNIDKEIEKIKKNDKNAATIKEFCNSLPIAAEIESNGTKILCLHGFIPKGNDYGWLDDTLRIKKSSEIDIEVKKPLLCNFYSIDGKDTTVTRGSNKVDCICKDTLTKFLNEKGYACIVRGHSHDKFSNRDIFKNGKCYSVYSAVDDYYNCYESNFESSSGILAFDENGIKTHIEYTKDGKRTTDEDFFSNLKEIKEKENAENIPISLNAEDFKKFVNEHKRGSIIFRGTCFGTEEQAEKYKDILCNKGIEEAIRTNTVKFGASRGNSQCFAPDIFRAFCYATRSWSGNIGNVYIAYVLDDDVVNYTSVDKIKAKTSKDIVVCNEPFVFNLEEYNMKIEEFNSNKENKQKKFRISNSEIEMIEFIKNYPDIYKDLVIWIKKCVGRKLTCFTFRNFMSNANNLKYCI